MKKLMITLVMALLVVSMSVSALAAPAAYGSSCNGNYVVSIQGCTTSQSGCVSEDCTKSLPDCVKAYGCNTAYPQCSGADTSNTAVNGTLSEDQLKAYGIDISGILSGKSTCPTASAAAADTASDDTADTQADAQTAVSAANSGSSCTVQQTADKAAKAAAAVQAAAETVTQSTSDEAQSADDTAAQENQQTCAGSGCEASDTCTQTSCTASGNNCSTVNCTESGTCANSAAAGTCTSGKNLYDILGAMLEKCGISPDILKYFGCTQTPSDSNSQTDEAGTDTTAPSDSDTSAPAEDDTAAPSGDDTANTSSGEDTTEPSGSGETESGTIDNLSFEQQVAVLVNEQRAAYGLEPLTLSTELSDVARVKSQDMHDNNYFSHTSPTYGSPFDMLSSFGISYRAAGENIAMGYATPEAVVDAWMNSEGHRANILSSNYTQIGVGYVADGSYWTQEFIG